LTTIAAVLFMVTSLSLAIFTVKKTSVMSSVPAQETPAKPLGESPAGPLQEQPVAPGQGEVQETPAPTTEESKPETK
jgi:preprotein translocase subunit SecG